MRPIRCVALILTAGLLAVAPVRAVPAVNPQVAPLVQELQQIVQVLNGTNHDYGGHRAAAIREVHKAIHALHPGFTLPQFVGGAARAVGRAVVPPVHEHQGLSDAQMMTALQRLQTLQIQMAGYSAGDVQKATAFTQMAIVEVKSALLIP